jgi:Restriction endonuclease
VPQTGLPGETTLTPEEFEQQVQRIHRAIESIDAQVTWNDRIPDPDNPRRKRQIDITIRRGDRLTLVECRARQDPQDVEWIEQLYGRRVGLRAQSVIGVSASGFTEGARRKASNLGVILREFETVTPEEVHCWGQPSELFVAFYEFQDCSVLIEMSTPIKSQSPSITGTNGEPVDWRSVLMELGKRYDLNAMGERFVGAHAKLEGILVDGTTPNQVVFQCRYRGTRRKIRAPSVGIYSNPVSDFRNFEARVDQFPVGQSQVIKSAEPSLCVLDLGSLVIPDNSIFGAAGFSQEGGMRLRSVQIVGLDNVLRMDVKISVHFRWPIQEM